jgi:hypothetical protein
MNIAPQLIEYKKKQDKNNKKIDLEKWKMKINKKENK